MRALLFDFAGRQHAIPLKQVREVVAAPKLTRLATAPPAVLGLFGVDGEIVPLLDAGLVIAGTTSGTQNYAVVVETPSGLGAIVFPVVPAYGDAGADVQLLDAEDLFVWAGGQEAA